MFDRILLLLLVLILPIGIIGSRIISGEIVLGNKQLTSDQEKKIDTFIQQVNKQITKLDASADKFNVTGAVYASESGILTVAGAAPEANLFMWVWVAGITPKKSDKEATPSAAKLVYKGPDVFMLQGNGFSVPVDVSEMNGVVEIRLDQGSRTKVVKFDLDKKKLLP